MNEIIHMVFSVMPYLIIATGVLILLYQSMIIVGGDSIATVERRWFGKKMPQGRIVAQNNEVGVQARTLGPGIHILYPFLYKVKKSQFTIIKDGYIGLVESVDGAAIPPGKIFAQVAKDHNNFQDGEAFLKNGGQKGPQIDVIPPGMYRINTFLFRVTPVSITEIPIGMVGVVISRDGRPIESGRLLAKSIPDHSNYEKGEVFLANGGQKGPQIDVLLPGKYRINTNLFRIETEDATVVPSGMVGLVTSLDGEPLPENEFVAKSVEGHKDFQDGQSFLNGKGQRGPQLDVLKPGTYYINPFMFKIEYTNVAVVERGQVAVVVSNVGKEPTDEMKKRIGSSQLGATEEEAQEKYVVPKEYRGIQEEVAGPGKYYLNPLAYMPYTIDTTNITIDWDEAKETRFDALSVISKDGFPIQVSVKVVIRVRPDQAPYMVAKVGSVKNLIEHVIHPMIDSSFRNQASTASAMNFLQNRSEEQDRAEKRARQDLEKYHVECVSVLICQITLPKELMDTQTKRIIAEQQQEMFAMEQKAQESRIATEKTKATADQQGELVKSEIAVKVANQKKLETITIAEGKARSTELEGEGESKKIAMIGAAEAEAYQKKKEALGSNAIMAIEVIDRIASGKIKVMPDILTIGGNGASDALTSTLTGILSMGSVKPNKDNIIQTLLENSKTKES